MTATIYFAGGEDIDFVFISAADPFAPDTTSGRFRSSWSRCAISGSPATGNGNVPPSNCFKTQLWSSSLTAFWLHAELSISNTAATTSGNHGLGIGDSGGTWRLLLTGTGTAGQFKISTRDSGGSEADLVTSAAGALVTGLQAVDIFVNYGTTGEISVYLDGSNVAAATYTGDVTTDGETSLAQAFFGIARSGTAVWGWSEVIVSDYDTRGMGLFTMQPVAAGNTQDWTGSASLINEVTLSDASWNDVVFADELSEWTCPTALPTGYYDVEAVTQTARINRGSVGPQHYEFVTRPAGSGSDFVSGDYHPGTSFGNQSYVWATNPATGNPWTTSDIGSGFNLGIESKA